jgi:hypothetical protein
MMQIGVEDIKNLLVIMMLKKIFEKTQKCDKIPFHSPLGGNN